MKNKFDINSYNAFLFDFDGVIADSNGIKLETFISVIKDNFFLSKAEIKDFLFYMDGENRENIFIKLTETKKRKKDFSIKEITQQYKRCLQKKLFGVEYSKNIDILHANNANAFWGIVSAGNSDEIEEFIEKKTNYNFFQQKIYGGELKKNIHVKKLFKNELIKSPILYFGDSELDYMLARQFNFDFVYISGWGKHRLDFKNFNYPFYEFLTLDEFINEAIA